MMKISSAPSALFAFSIASEREVQTSAPGASYTAFRLTTIFIRAGIGRFFSPTLTVVSLGGAALNSSNGAEEHGFACSDIDEPESWPLFNYGTAGNKGAKILRGIPCRDRIYCLMDDGTVQVISGNAPPFRVDELSATVRIIGPDTAQVLNEQVWAFSTQGVVTISEAGVGLIGLPIEADTRTLFGSALETAKLRSFAFAYESERTYGLWLPARAGERHPSKGYLFNYATKAWVNFPEARSCGAVDPYKDVLHMGLGSINNVVVERKTLTADDFADDDWSITISAVAEATLTVSATTGIHAGDVLEQDSIRAVVESVTNATTLVVSTEEDWEIAAATVYEAIACDVEYLPTALGAPGLLKDVSDFALLFYELACFKAEGWVSTDLSFAWSRTKSFSRAGFGSQEWNAPWGDPAGPYIERMGVAGQKHSLNFVVPRFTIREAFASWKLLGYSLEHEVIGGRTKP